MKRLILLFLFIILPLFAYSQTDSVEIKLINEYNAGIKQLEQLVEQQAVLEGYINKKAEYIKQYGLIDSAMMANNIDLKKRIDEYKTLEETLKRVSDSIPKLKGALQAIVDEINLIRENKKK